MKNKDYFIPKMFRRLLIPSVFSSLGFALADMADALVIGQKTGETGLAAISLCLPVFMLINMFMDALAIGGSVRYSQKLGEGEADGAVACFNRIWRMTLAVGLLIGISANIFAPQLLSLLGTKPGDGELYAASESYMRIITLGSPVMMLNIVLANFLRNDNNAALAARGFLIGNAADIILNIVLVIVLDMGTSGAALATVIGSAVAVGCYLPGVLPKGADILRVRRVRADIAETASCFKTGFSTSVQHLFRLLFFLIVNRILMNLNGEGGVAVFDVVYNASFFIIYLYNGTAEAFQPLVSTFTGENSDEDCRQVLGLAERSGLCLGGVAAVLIFIFARSVSAMFGISEELMPLAASALRIYCTGFAFIGLNIIYEQYYQAKENARAAFFIALMRGFVVLIPCVFIFSLFGIKLIWLMFPAAELVSLVLFVIYRFFIAKRETGFDKERILRVTVTNKPEDLETALSRTEAFCERWEANARQKYFVTLIIEEISMSIIRNALKDVPGGKIRITLLAMEGGDFKLHILDNAVKFNPFSHRANKIEINKEFDIDDVSMMLIKKETKKFMYRQCHGFNSLVVRI